MPAGSILSSPHVAAAAFAMASCVCRPATSVTVARSDTLASWRRAPLVVQSALCKLAPNAPVVPEMVLCISQKEFCLVRRSSSTRVMLPAFRGRSISSRSVPAVMKNIA